jgi:hypothetical protein
LNDSFIPFTVIKGLNATFPGHLRFWYSPAPPPPKQFWGLNPGPYTFWTSALPLEPCSQLIQFFEVGFPVCVLRDGKVLRYLHGWCLPLKWSSCLLCVLCVRGMGNQILTDMDTWLATLEVS